MTYMQELDQWTDENIFAPLNEVLEGRRPAQEVADQIEKAVRVKVLESYRNGANRCPNCHGGGSKPSARPMTRPYRPRQEESHRDGQEDRPRRAFRR
jgi:hypothetical protein